MTCFWDKGAKFILWELRIYTRVDVLNLIDLSSVILDPKFNILVHIPPAATIYTNTITSEHGNVLYLYMYKIYHEDNFTF